MAGVEVPGATGAPNTAAQPKLTVAEVKAQLAALGYSPDSVPDSLVATFLEESGLMSQQGSGSSGGKPSGQASRAAQSQPEPLLSQWGTVSRPLSQPGLELRGGAPLSWTAPAVPRRVPSASVAGVAAPAPPATSGAGVRAASRAAPPALPERSRRATKGSVVQRPSTAGSGRAPARRTSPRQARPGSAGTGPGAAKRCGARPARGVAGQNTSRRRKRVPRKRSGGSPGTTSAGASDVTAVDLLPSPGVQGSELDGVDVVFQEDLDRERALEAERRQIEAQMYAQEQHRLLQERQERLNRQRSWEEPHTTPERARLPAPAARTTTDDVGGNEAVPDAHGESAPLGAWDDDHREASLSPRGSVPDHGHGRDDYDRTAEAPRRTPRPIATRARSPSNVSRGRIAVPATPRSVVSRGFMSPGCECGCVPC